MTAFGIGPWLENAAWAAAFACIVIFADGWWKLLALLCFLGLNTIRKAKT